MFIKIPSILRVKEQPTAEIHLCKAVVEKKIMCIKNVSARGKNNEVAEYLGITALLLKHGAGGDVHIVFPTCQISHLPADKSLAAILKTSLQFLGDALQRLKLPL